MRCINSIISESFYASFFRIINYTHVPFWKLTKLQLAVRRGIFCLISHINRIHFFSYLAKSIYSSLDFYFQNFMTTLNKFDDKKITFGVWYFFVTLVLCLWQQMWMIRFRRCSWDIKFSRCHHKIRSFW